MNDANDIRPIRWNFDEHICVACRGRNRHRIGHVLVDPGDEKGDFMLKCTNCGAEDGPHIGPRQRDDEGNWLRLTPPAA